MNCFNSSHAVNTCEDVYCHLCTTASEINASENQIEKITVHGVPNE